MKKGQQAERYKIAMASLDANGLTDSQLSTVRKLCGVTMFVNERPHLNNRTVEAILQGRRTNNPVLLEIIQVAERELERLNKEMKMIRDQLSSNATTSDMNSI